MPNWTHEDDCNLLLAIIAQQGKLSVNWDDAVTYMGEKFTKKAMTLRWAKLRGDAANTSKNETNANNDGPVTPKKPKTTPTKKKVSEEDVVPSVEPEESPRKKAKKEETD